MDQIFQGRYNTSPHWLSCVNPQTRISGSNGCNDDTSAAINTGTSLDSRNGDGFQNGNGKGLDLSCSRREAALIRFHLKRKDRCFGKKVRYYGRKELAEHRPRMKGRFVRQAVAEISESNDRVKPFTQFEIL
ncbi:two-component response regulator-like PRR37 [Telopea speciosissima]|uniref:two-component response regulator-like PRR37 n=1 Tax=Telopea speciosissima TaxID=54955 RepID=UPI001CC4E839|nr:two-component response regulator-like PRR37 [Telopea speciosissima]